MKPQKYPVDNGTSFDWMDRADYLSINLGKWNKRYGDVFTKKKLMDMLDAVEAGMKIGNSEDEAVQSVWEQMEGDYETAKTYSPTVEVEIVEGCADSEMMRRDIAESKELEIIQFAGQPLNLGVALGEVLQKFNHGQHLTQCRPREGTTDLDIGRGIAVLSGVKNWTELGLGDLINELEDRGYENVIPQLISEIGLEESYPTLSAYARTARAVSNDLRELPGLHYSHLQEVANSRFSKDPTEQAKAVREVLTDASERRLNVSQTREAVLNRKGKSTKPTPPSAPVAPVRKHGRYIVLLPENCIMSYSCDELPENESGAIIIDTLEGDISCQGCSAGVPVWQALSYRKLAPVIQVVEVEK